MKKEKKVKVKNRRSQVEFPSLDPKYNLKTRQEEIEDIASYANKLPKEAKQWLAKFADEYVGASFGKNSLHKTKELKKSVYDSNNRRNRDIFTKAKAMNKLIMGYEEGKVLKRDWEDSDDEENGED